MASYYYLISSLPMLSADGGMPFSYEEFLKMCQANVSGETYKLLEGLSLSSDEGPLLEEWGAFYNGLMKELNSQRSLKLGKPYPPVYDKEPASASVVTAAISAKDPLAAERILLEHEFDQLDIMVGLHSFDDWVLFGYAVKLKLLERIGSFVKEKGKKEFNDILSDLEEQVTRL
ncbi:MAG: hypothetical protein IKX89_05620 [Firmicutes bacterium]|nr:hypothetical protein [Bacillota bacterium]